MHFEATSSRFTPKGFDIYVFISIIGMNYNDTMCMYNTVAIWTGFLIHSAVAVNIYVQ